MLLTRNRSKEPTQYGTAMQAALSADSPLFDEFGNIRSSRPPARYAAATMAPVISSEPTPETLEPKKERSALKGTRWAVKKTKLTIIRKTPTTVPGSVPCPLEGAKP